MMKLQDQRFVYFLSVKFYSPLKIPSCLALAVWLCYILLKLPVF